MLTEKDKKEIAKNIYISGINSKLERLEFQRSRILPFDYKNLKANPGHDADFYMVLLRRLYREVEELSKIDSRVANLKGTYGKTVKKLKIRDHYEHKINYDEFKSKKNAGIDEANGNVSRGNRCF